MSNRRAQNRREARARHAARFDPSQHPSFRRHDVYPMIPGVVPELTEETKARCMAQAHEELGPLPNTRVTVTFYRKVDAEQVLRSLYLEHPNCEDNVALMMAQFESVVGPDPHLVIAMRVDRT